MTRASLENAMVATMALGGSKDLHGVGGVPGVMRYLLDEGLLDGDQLTVTGKTIGENLESAPHLAADHDIVSKLEG